jgi:hypothetical protein
MMHHQADRIGCWAIVISMIMGAGVANACTTGVISGKATIDGRPLLWKNRDAPYKNNQVRRFTGGKYACTAIVNAGQNATIWMGVNDAGFCIENSVTSDLSEKGSKGMGNGAFMLRALKSCATVEEFAELLHQTNGKRSTNANFGVIDAVGGAAIFESGASSFKMFDANDPAVAPKGYVIRSNFSFTGNPSIDPSDRAGVNMIYSGGRFLRGCQLVDMAIADGGVSVEYLLQHNTRDLADSDGNAICGTVNGDVGALPTTVDTSHTISRRTSVSAAVFHGVKPGEDHRLTTMWVMLGEPAFTLAVPCWAAVPVVATELSGDKTSSLCDAARDLRDAAYLEIEADDTEQKKRVFVLATDCLPAIWKATLPRERQQLRAVTDALETWRQEGFDPVIAESLHRSASSDALGVLQKLTSPPPVELR